MFSKANFISTIICAFWAFFGGYLLWGILAEPILQEFATKAPNQLNPMPDFSMLAIGCVIMAFSFSTTYSKWARGIHHTKHGIEFGCWLGVLLGFGNGIIDYATDPIFNLYGTLINGIVFCLFFTIMGILASFCFSRFS